MKKAILLTLVMLLTALTGAAARRVETAADVMAACAARINKAPSLSAKFTLTAGEMQYPCAMTVCKQKYTMVTPQMRVWYNGQTQWVYAVESHELSISDPDADELLETNPFAIINHYAQAYNCRLLQPEQGNKVVELTPKNKKSAPVRAAVVHISDKTSLPVKITVTLANGRVINALIGTLTVGKAIPGAAFVFNKADYKVSETIDLR